MNCRMEIERELALEQGSGIILQPCTLGLSFQDSFPLIFPGALARGGERVSQSGLGSAARWRTPSPFPRQR